MEKKKYKIKNKHRIYTSGAYKSELLSTRSAFACLRQKVQQSKFKTIINVKMPQIFAIVDASKLTITSYSSSSGLPVSASSPAKSANPLPLICAANTASSDESEPDPDPESLEPDCLAVGDDVGLGVGDAIPVAPIDQVPVDGLAALPPKLSKRIV